MWLSRTFEFSTFSNFRNQTWKRKWGELLYFLNSKNVVQNQSRVSIVFTEWDFMIFVKSIFMTILSPSSSIKWQLCERWRNSDYAAWCYVQRKLCFYAQNRATAVIHERHRHTDRQRKMFNNTHNSCVKIGIFTTIRLLAALWGYFFNKLELFYSGYHTF
jgi:hypothetical protein